MVHFYRIVVTRYISDMVKVRKKELVEALKRGMARAVQFRHAHFGHGLTVGGKGESWHVTQMARGNCKVFIIFLYRRGAGSSPAMPIKSLTEQGTPFSIKMGGIAREDMFVRPRHIHQSSIK